MKYLEVPYLEHSIKAEDTRYRDFTAEKDSYFQQSGIPFGFHSHPEQTGLGLGSFLGLVDFRLYSEKLQNFGILKHF